MAKLDNLVVGTRDTRGKHGGLCLCLGSFKLMLLSLALQGRQRLLALREGLAKVIRLAAHCGKGGRGLIGGLRTVRNCLLGRSQLLVQRRARGLALRHLIGKGLRGLLVILECGLGVDHPGF